MARCKVFSADSDDESADSGCEYGDEHYLRDVPVYAVLPAEQDADGMVDRIRRLAEASGLDFEVMFAGEPLCSDPDGPFIRELLKLSGSERAETVSYGTDGAVFTELRDIAVWGPGSIAQAHTDDEWISVEQLERGTELYRQAIVRWCG